MADHEHGIGRKYVAGCQGCKDLNRERTGPYFRQYYRSGKWHRNLADQLARGVELQNVSNHHKGMAELKAKLGQPRPPGTTLSLVDWDSPSAYWGYCVRDGEHRPYRLSANPDDYVWETQGENQVRDAERRKWSKAGAF